MVYGEKEVTEDEVQNLLNGKRDADGNRHGGLRSRQLQSVSADMLDELITDREVEGVMEHLPLSKSAGPDRIPNGVYKSNPIFWSKKLGAVLREATEQGSLPPSILKGDISMLYKKDDRDDPRHYRPITLLQNAYKIFTRILAKRMKKVVHEFVSESQKGFVPHAFIAECSMLLNLI
jgi:hypothetical protein